MKKLLIEGIIAFFVLFGILDIISMATSHLSSNKLSKIQVTQKLFNGHCAASFNVKTIVINNNGDETKTTEKTLKNVQWAQLRLWPTIGCTRPTLFYLADNNQQVKMMEVDEAKIIQ